MSWRSLLVVFSITSLACGGAAAPAGSPGSAAPAAATPAVAEEYHAGAASTADVSGTLCQAGEEPMLTCAVGAKQMSLCRQGEVLRYRFGKRGAIELAWPDGDVPVDRAYTWSSTNEWSGPSGPPPWQDSSLKFSLQGRLYDIEETTRLTADVRIVVTGTDGKVTTLPCTDAKGTLSDMAHAMDLPVDPGF